VSTPEPEHALVVFPTDDVGECVIGPSVKNASAIPA
jgi:hypothetical protein